MRLPLTFESSLDGGATRWPAGDRGADPGDLVIAPGALFRSSVDAFCVPGDLRRFTWGPSADEGLQRIDSDHHAVIVRVAARPAPGACIPG